jgi:cellulose 1,4-beta-cellobiosidase
MGQEKCANAAPAYLECATYALQSLNLPNVAVYIDAGHAGWLGWYVSLLPLHFHKRTLPCQSNLVLRPGNPGKAAAVFGDLFEQAGRPKAVRGLVTNVSNFNGWKLETPPVYAARNPNWDESKYHDAITPYLEEVGFPAHFLVDTGESDLQHNYPPYRHRTES